MNKTDERGKSVLREIVALIPAADAESLEVLRRFHLVRVLEADHIDPLRDAGLIDGNAMLTEKGAAEAYQIVSRETA